MRASEYTSSYLTADDVKTPKVLTVEQVTEETIGNDSKPKLVLYGRDDVGDDHKIALNKSNITKLIELFKTDETEDWIGLVVCCYRDPNVMFNNRRVGGIAFRKAPADAVAAEQPVTPGKRKGKASDEPVPFE